MLIKVLAFHSTLQSEFINSHTAFKVGSQHYVWYFHMKKGGRNIRILDITQILEYHTKDHTTFYQQPHSSPRTPLIAHPSLDVHSHIPSLCYPYTRNNFPLPDYFTITPGHPPCARNHSSNPTSFRQLHNPNPFIRHDTFSFFNVGCKWICLSPENFYVMSTLKACLPNYSPTCGSFYGKKTDWN